VVIAVADLQPGRGATATPLRSRPTDTSRT
jgi:hypothetical protein